MEPAMAWAVSFAVIWSIPGIFGFLVWELTANWRLYAANRRRNLFPVRIGAHGETVPRLLKPGVHSGTLPKRFAKLRAPQRHARADGNWRSVHSTCRRSTASKSRSAAMLSGKFLELFAESRCWQAPPPSWSACGWAPTASDWRSAARRRRAPLQIALEVESGWLVAGVTAAGWVDRLLPPQRQVLVTAMIGLYKSAGVDLVRQQIERAVPPAGGVVRRFRRGARAVARRRRGRGSALRSSRRPVDRPAVGPRIGPAVVADGGKATTHLRRGVGALGRLGLDLESGPGRTGPSARIGRPRPRVVLRSPLAFWE